MPISLFELVMAWVFGGALLLGLAILFVGLRQKERRLKALHFALAIAIPLSAWAILRAGSAMGI